MAVQNCPEKQVLLAFAAGRGDAPLRNAVQAHLDQCPQCRQVVATAADSTADRQGTSVDSPSEALVVSGSYLGRDIIDVDSSEPHTGLSSSQEELESRFDFRLLEPPQQAGALGHLGKYVVLEVLGYGGMGVVFRAKDEQLLRTVAIKVMSRQLASSATARRRFTREARAAAAINHPNVVTIHAVEEHNGTPFLVMEFIQGESLRDRLRHRPQLTIADVVSIAFQVASGLAAAHAHGVIHRDIKPGNVMLEDELARVKITDFGLARVAVDNVDLTSNQIGIGTPAYMSPEQMKGEEIDPRSDLFALGCVMYAMLRGHSPFHGRTALEIARNVADRDPSPPIADAGIPPFLSEIIDRLLEKSPEKRYQSAGEVAQLLRQHLAVLNQTPTDKLDPFLLQRSARTRRPTWALVAMVAIGLLAVTALVAWFGIRGAPSPILLGPSPPPVASPAVRPAPRTLTVAQSGDADFTSLNAALQQAGPDCTIQILDSGEYHESLVLNNAQKWSGITIEGVRSPPPTIVNPDVLGAVVRIENVPGVVFRRLNIRQVAGKQEHHAVLITGPAAGVTLDRVLAEGDSQKFALVFVRFAWGEPDQPIVIRDSQIDSATMGIVIQADQQTNPVRHIWLLNNHFYGPATTTHVQFNIAARDARVVGNVFRGGKGVALGLSDATSSGNLTIGNNTFFRNESWLALRKTSPELPGVVIANNLMLESANNTIATEDHPPAEFVKHKNWTLAGNHWEISSPTSDEALRGFAEIHRHIEMVSREPDNPGFLRLKTPLAAAPPSTAGLPSYVGALPP